MNGDPRTIKSDIAAMFQALRAQAIEALQRRNQPMPQQPPPPVGMPGMTGGMPPPMSDPTLAAGMAQGAMGGPPPMGPGRPSGMDGSIMSGKDHLTPLEAPDPDQEDAGTGGLLGGDLLGIGKADAAELRQGMAAGRDLLNTPRASGATPIPAIRPGGQRIPMLAVRPRVPVPSSRPDVMPHQAPGYGPASGYDPGAAYASPVTAQGAAPGSGGPPRGLFPWSGQTQAPVGGPRDLFAGGGGVAYGGTTAGGMAHGGGTGGTAGQGADRPPVYLMDYIARMMGRG